MKTMLLTVTLLGLAVSQAAAAEKPNFLWLTSEDHGPHMGCYGDALARTPNIDALAAKGMLFRRAWSVAPVCAPARTAIIAGVYPASSGGIHMRSMVSLAAGQKMYPQYLREAGYFCTNNSKTDYNLREPGQVWDESSGKAHWKNRAAGQPFFAIFNSTKSHESQIRTRPHVQITRPADVPVPAYHPDVPEVRQDWAQYYDKVGEADADAGRRLKELEEAGLAADTIVFYYADHGSGMPRSKRWPCNSGLHVPMVVYFPPKWQHLAPKEYKKGAASDRLVSFVDLAPTMLSLAGIKPPDWMQGNAFAGPYQGPPPPYLFGERGRMDERMDLVRSVTDGRYVYLRNYHPHVSQAQRVAYQFETSTTRVWHDLFTQGKTNEPQSIFWRVPKEVEELYDLETDADEVRNLAQSPEHRAVVTKLREALRRHLIDVKDVGFLPESELHARAGNLSPYELARGADRYPLEKILAAAELASNLDPSAGPRLNELLTDDDMAVRYWGALGLLMRGKDAIAANSAGLEAALADRSPAVQIVAAQALAVHGNEAIREKALQTLASLAVPKDHGVLVAMSALAAIEALGPKGASLHDQIARLNPNGPSPDGRYNSYVPRLIANIVDESNWQYAPELLRPFWQGTVSAGESVLFIKDSKSGEAKASVLFPVRQVLAVRNSAGDITYENGRDFVWKPGSREIVLPAGSRIVSRLPAELRRPAKSQKYELTHRDGDGEIFFGARLEYADMQTCITYSHDPNLWKSPVPKFDAKALPRSVFKLLNKQPLSIVVVGDSISAGCNASGWAKGAPFQPAYPELLRRHLEARCQGKVTLQNPSVGGTDTGWVLTMIDKVVEPRPDLVIVAFGMNDAAGRSAQEYQANTEAVIAKIRQRLPDVEFILVASMLGNRDWTRLKPELFPQYRDALAGLCKPGIALADLTSIWTGFLERKQDWDQTGNGVNHPNDFGHRVYAQVLATLLVPDGEPDAQLEPAKTIEAGPLRLIEQRLLGNYTYSYACAAADLDGDGDLDLTSSDAEPNSNLYLLLNDGKGNFRHSFVQKYAQEGDQPVRLERHALGDVNGDGRPDIVIVDNLKWDIRWFENPSPDEIARPWKLRRVCAPKEVPGSYDVALADLDGDGDLDVAASSWRFGNRFDWFENAGSPGRGDKWVRHPVEDMIGETRTIAVADFNRDGKPDLLGTSRTGNQILWYANSGRPKEESWKKTVIDGVTLAPAHGHPVDMDGDGDLDVVMACGIAAGVGNQSPESHQVAWYENVGRPGLGTQWKKHAIAANFPQGFEAVAGDLDGDGDQDVVATGWSPQGRIAWFENTGDPKTGWKQHLIKENWSNAVTVILADLDKDGRLDIVACAERGANELRWWRNGGKAASPK